MFLDKAALYELERAEAENHRLFVEACRELYPNEVVSVEENDSGLMAFTGVDSPLSQSMALGFKGPVDAHCVKKIEAFYRQFDCPANIEVANVADASLTEQLVAHDFKVTEYSHVLVQELREAFTSPVIDGVVVRCMEKGEEETVARVLSEGFIGAPDSPHLPLFNGFVRQKNASVHVAVIQETIVAAAGLFMHGNIALIGVATTLPAYRGRGLQKALITARLNWAIAQGCNRAMVVTEPATISQKNVQKMGFSIAYARAKFTKETN